MQPYEQRFPWNLDWNLLRTFMIVVDQKGLTRAADYLGVTQPTISSALKRLEARTFADSDPAYMCSRYARAY